jgi:ribosome-binding factor A
MTHRLQRVKELIRRELGMILERDLDFGGAFVTIHDVDLTPDLKQCFVHVGVLGGKPGAAEASLRKLETSRGQIQRALYKRVILRYSPQLLFRLDNSVERGVRVLQLIESLPEPLPDEEDTLDEPGTGPHSSPSA